LEQGGYCVERFFRYGSVWSMPARQHTPQCLIHKPLRFPPLLSCLHSAPAVVALTPSTSPIFTTLFSSSQTLCIFNSSWEEKRMPFNRFLPIVSFKGIVLLKPRRTPKLRTFIWQCKPHGPWRIRTPITLLD
jgi:hypothetical protein